jgi:hypothetical protein
MANASRNTPLKNAPTYGFSSANGSIRMTRVHTDEFGAMKSVCKTRGLMTVKHEASHAVVKECWLTFWPRSWSCDEETDENVSLRQDMRSHEHRLQ